MKLHDLYLERYRMREVLITAATVAICFSMGLHDLNAEEGMSLKLTSPAFVHGEGIPRKYTCEGADISPPLKWEGLPHNARSLVLIVDDPDAPDPKAPKMTWVHWVLYNIPPDTTGLPEGVKTDELPAGTGEGLNSWKRTGYGGPCPPMGRHRYFHKLYALDMVLSNIERPTKSQIEVAMKGHIIAQTELVGTYEKSK
jgi:Raf kinase inhibitor-like YbhB/YbcL family protein